MTLNGSPVEAWLNRWIPIMLKLTGLVGAATCVGIYVLTKVFDPVAFGMSLTAGTGGYLGDAFNNLRKEKGG